MFALAFAITLIVGLVFWLPSKRVPAEMRTRDGFLITVFFWLVLSTFGALPLMLSEAAKLSFINALFESVSGFTTTGATVISGLDDLPKSILYYRQQLQWLGGIGIVVIAVAILPMLGCRWHAAVPRRNPRASEGFQADAAHYRNCQCAVSHLSGPNRRLCSGLLGRPA